MASTPIAPNFYYQERTGRKIQFRYSPDVTRSDVFYFPDVVYLDVGNDPDASSNLRRLRIWADEAGLDYAKIEKQGLSLGDLSTLAEIGVRGDRIYKDDRVERGVIGTLLYSDTCETTHSEVMSSFRECVQNGKGLVADLFELNIKEAVRTVPVKFLRQAGIDQVCARTDWFTEGWELREGPTHADEIHAGLMLLFSRHVSQLGAVQDGKEASRIRRDFVEEIEDYIRHELQDYE